MMRFARDPFAVLTAILPIWRVVLTMTIGATMGGIASLVASGGSRDAVFTFWLGGVVVMTPAFPVGLVWHIRRSGRQLADDRSAIILLGVFVIGLILFALWIRPFVEGTNAT